MGEAHRARKFMFDRGRLHPQFTLAGRGRPLSSEGVPMPFAALLLPFRAAAQVATAPPPSHAPIVVTGRGGVPFISPMGEPIRARAPNEDTLARWFNQVDRNRDGFLTPDELVADAERYFDLLDANHDGQIDPDELVHYEWTIAPEIQVNSRLRRARAPGEAPPKAEAENSGESARAGREARDRNRSQKDGGLQGAARYALLNMPEPVAAADADFNRSITLQEFRQAARDRFALLDKQHQGRLTLPELEALKPVLSGGRGKRSKDERDARIGIPLPPGD
jgi:Ca2+-binding EF-hand superfamily protein